MASSAVVFLATTGTTVAGRLAAAVGLGAEVDTGDGDRGGDLGAVGAGVGAGSTGERGGGGDGGFVGAVTVSAEATVAASVPNSHWSEGLRVAVAVGAGVGALVGVAAMGTGAVAGDDATLNAATLGSSLAAPGEKQMANA